VTCERLVTDSDALNSWPVLAMHASDAPWPSRWPDDSHIFIDTSRRRFGGRDGGRSRARRSEGKRSLKPRIERRQRHASYFCKNSDQTNV